MISNCRKSKYCHSLDPLSQLTPNILACVEKFCLKLLSQIHSNFLMQSPLGNIQNKKFLKKLKVNDKEHQCSLVVSSFRLRARIGIPCALCLRCSALFGVAAHSPSTPSLPLSTVYSVWQVPVSLFYLRAQGWVA